LSEALGNKEWEKAMKVEMEALEKKQNLGNCGITRREEVGRVQMGVYCEI